jgi:hypothetical protein
MLAGLLAPLLARWGVTEAEAWAKRLAPILIAIALLATLWAAYALIRSDGEKAGAAKEEVKAAKGHAEAVANARADEHTAQAVSNRIAASAARSDDMTTTYVRSTIEDMHHAYDAVPPAAPAAVPPPAPVDSVRDNLNAIIARSNRAAAAGGAAGGDDANDQAGAADR